MPTSDPAGPRLTEVLHEAWENPFTTKSDFARDYANDIAMAASMGLITTACGLEPNCFGNVWKITMTGLNWLLEGTDE